MPDEASHRVHSPNNANGYAKHLDCSGELHQPPLLYTPPPQHGASALLTLKELVRCAPMWSKTVRVMLRITALYRDRGIKPPGTSVYRQSKRKEWLTGSTSVALERGPRRCSSDWTCCKRCGAKRRSHDHRGPRQPSLKSATRHHFPPVSPGVLSDTRLPNPATMRCSVA
jgi:hypothetical protein